MSCVPRGWDRDGSGSKPGKAWGRSNRVGRDGNQLPAPRPCPPDGSPRPASQHRCTAALAELGRPTGQGAAQGVESSRNTPATPAATAADPENTGLGMHANTPKSSPGPQIHCVRDKSGSEGRRGSSRCGRQGPEPTAPAARGQRVPRGSDALAVLPRSPTPVKHRCVFSLPSVITAPFLLKGQSLIARDALLVLPPSDRPCLHQDLCSTLAVCQSRIPRRWHRSH